MNMNLTETQVKGGADGRTDKLMESKLNRCMGVRMYQMDVFKVYALSTITCVEVLVLETIMKTRLYNFGPLKPHFYLVKLGFTGVYIIFLISAQNIDCGYSLEPPRRGGSNEYPQSMF